MTFLFFIFMTFYDKAHNINFSDDEVSVVLLFYLLGFFMECLWINAVGKVRSK